MNSMIPLNDPMNLRDFITLLTDHIRDHGSGDASPKNIVSFFTLILTGTDTAETRKESMVSMMQRLLSGNISYEAKTIQMLAREICSGDQDDSLLERLAPVVCAVGSCPDEADFYGILYKQCSFRFFSPEELELLGDLLQKKDYPRYLLAMLKHGFDTLYNIPCFFAQRMYEEAITCDWDSPHRFALMKIAADNGNRDAAMEFANYLARRFGKDSDADRYFKMALPKQEAVWSLANRIEIEWISQDRVPDFRSALRVEDKIAGPEFDACREELEGIMYAGPDPDRSETMLFLYKVYFYLAYQDFFKGFHSMAKQLETGMIRFSGPGGDAKAAMLTQKYRTAARKASNVISLLSEGTSILESIKNEGEFEPGSEKERRMLELLALAADMDLLYGNYCLGAYYEYASHKDPDRRMNRETARMYYQRAEELDVNKDGRNGLLWLKLGLVSDSAEDKQHFLEKALDAKQWDAAYYLAEMEQKQYLSGGKAARLHLYNAVKLLKEYLPLISETNKKMAELLYRVLVSAIEDEEKEER